MIKGIIDGGLVVVTVVMMLSVGLALSGELFRKLWQRRVPFLTILLFVIVVPPLLAALVGSVSGLSTDMLAALLLLAACPVGDIANVYTLRAHGNVALSLGLNILSSVLLPLTMPAVFMAYRLAGIDHELFRTPAAGHIAKLFLIVAVPILAGWWLRARKPKLAERMERPVHLFCSLGIGFLVVFVLAARHADIRAHGLPIAGVSVAFIGVTMITGLILTRLLKSHPEESAAVTCCVPVRNVGIAALAAITLGNQLWFAGPVAVYFVIEVPLLLGVAAWLRRRSSTRPSVRSA